MRLLYRFFKETLNKAFPFMVRQGSPEQLALSAAEGSRRALQPHSRRYAHERKQRLAVRPEPVEGLNQCFLKFTSILFLILPHSVLGIQSDDLSLDQQNKAEDKPCLNLNEQSCFTDQHGDTWCKKEPGPDTDKSFRDCPYCPEMVRLPSGIAIGKYEVTQEQWRAVMGRNPSQFADCANCPVEQVSWDEVHDYIKRLNKMTAKHYRLPTEREWYAACQSGSHHKYCGSDNIDEVAWYMWNSADHTHPVGGASPNAYGLYDMSGNVWEWTSGCCSNDCSCRIYRGGSWAMEPPSVRSDVIQGFGAKVSFFTVGFRLVRD
jgi:hypothetical protein